MQTATRLMITVLALSSTLSGCGGGGGDTAPIPPAPTGPQGVDSNIGRNGILESPTYAAEAATNLPRFGSVTQGETADGQGVSVQAAQAAYDPTTGHVTVRISAPGEPDLRLDTRNAYDEKVSTGIVTDGVDRAIGHVIVDADIPRRTLTAAALVAGQRAADFAKGPSHEHYGDWLAGGYWLQIGFTDDLDLAHGSAGAFVDGPEFDRDPDYPVSGTATYDGATVGMYAVEYGTDSSLPGGTGLGDFTGDISLTANFATKRIAGQITGIEVSELAVDANATTLYEFEEALPGAVIRLGDASFGADGTFRAQDVTVDGGSAFTVATSSGAWGGDFSGRTENAAPRLVAGTAGASFATAGGTEGALVGAWIADQVTVQ